MVNSTVYLSFMDTVTSSAFRKIIWKGIGERILTQISCVVRNFLREISSEVIKLPDIVLDHYGLVYREKKALERK